MATFTIEWLSQSFYSTQENAAEEVEDAQIRRPHEGAEDFTPASPNNSCGYTSASDSSDLGEDSEEAARRRVRTKFSSDQIRKLEATFNKHRYLGASQRRKIAEKLHLSETQVKTWFQNRRMKLKREVQDMRTEFLAVPSALLPPGLFQHHQVCGQFPGASRGLYPLQEPHRAASHQDWARHQQYHPYTLPARHMTPVYY